VIDYRHISLLLAFIWLGWALSFLRSDYRSAKRVQIYDASSFSVAVIIIAIIGVALPLPFISLLPFASE